MTRVTLDALTQAMRVDLINFRGAVPIGSSTAGLLAEWRVGAILQAVAVRDSRGQLWLDISGARHAARVASGDGRGPAHGEHLQVRVLRNSPVLALETLPASAASDATADVVADALRRHVPRQASPALMLANLAWIAQGKSGSSGLPKPVVQAALNLWQALPSAESLAEPESLQNAVQRSGAFLESNLAAANNRATAATVVATDLKALMLTLGRTLREQGARPAAARTDTAMHAPVPTSAGPLTPLQGTPATFALVDTSPQHMNELSRQTEGAVARLNTLQIANSAQDGAVQTMLVEIPVRHDDRASMLRLRIERDESREHEQQSESTWTLEAALDLGAVGPLHARVTLTGHRIGVQLRAASPAFVDILSARTVELEAMLRESGLEIDRVVCLHGMPAGDTGAKPTRLLDVRA